MTIKVIDLFNKVANNEKIPEYIKIKNLKYQRQWSDYCGDEPICDLYVAIDKNNFKTLKDFSLDDEIEIIEDTPKEIKSIKKERLCLTAPEINLFDRPVRRMINENRDKIDEVVDAVNYLLKREK